MNYSAFVTNSYGNEWSKPVQHSGYHLAMNQSDVPSVYYHYLSKMLTCPSLCLIVSAHPPDQKNYLANAVGLVLGQDVLNNDPELKFRAYSAENKLGAAIVPDLEGLIREGGTYKVICLSHLPIDPGFTELEALFLRLKELIEINFVTIIVCLELRGEKSLGLRDLGSIEPICDLICVASMPVERLCEEKRYVILSLLKNRFGDIPKPFKGPWPYLEMSDVSEDLWLQIP